MLTTLFNTIVTRCWQQYTSPIYPISSNTGSQSSLQYQADKLPRQPQPCIGFSSR